MKFSHKQSFTQIVRTVSSPNVRNLIEKAELAAGLARFCPHRRQQLLKIEQNAWNQLHVIHGSTFGSVLATV